MSVWGQIAAIFKAHPRPAPRPPVPRPTLRPVAVIVGGITAGITGARVSLQISASAWLAGTTNADGYVLFPEVSSDLVDTALRIEAEGYEPLDLSVRLEPGAQDLIVGVRPGQIYGIHQRLVRIDPLQPLRPMLQRLRIDGTRFVTADGQLFIWRGISAFRLVEMMAYGRVAEAKACLQWAAAHDVTVVRVFAMCQHLFPLRPEDGCRALPALLALAARHGVYVEVVACVDTVDLPLAVIQSQLARVGEIVAAHPVALLEGANEPLHPSQHPDLPYVVTHYVPPAGVLYAPGAAHGADDESRAFTGGTYVTVHGDRNDAEGGWRPVRHTKEQRDLAADIRKPVVNDEPSRDLDPVRHRALAWLCRIYGLGDTYHYRGGLDARIPEGDDLAYFDARRQGWRDIPDDWQGAYRNAGHIGSPVRSFSGALRVYSSIGDTEGYTLVLDSGPETRIEWAEEWPGRTLRHDLGGVQLWKVGR